MTEQSEYDNSYDVEQLIDKLDNIALKEDTFINLKADNPSIHDFTITAMIVTKPKIEQGESSGVRDEPIGGYPIHHTNNYDKSQYTPLEKMRNEPINPYGIYLDLDCVNNVEEVIDKWETTFRIVVCHNPSRADDRRTRQTVYRSLIHLAQVSEIRNYPDLYY